MNWMGLLGAVAAVLLAYLLYRGVRSNPKAFSKKNLGESLTTIGLLALLVMAVVYIAVWYLKTNPA